MSMTSVPTVSCVLYCTVVIGRILRREEINPALLYIDYVSILLCTIHDLRHFLALV